MKILRIDQTHPVLDRLLTEEKIRVDVDLQSDYQSILQKIGHYQGLILRSRLKIDKTLIDRGKNLKFIVRVGSGLEGIDVTYAEKKGIKIMNTPEGNADAVGEMAVGLLIGLTRNIVKSHNEISSGKWKRNENRGTETGEKTIAIIGYGHTGQSFARKLAGFGSEVIFYDIKPGLENEFAREASMQEIFEKADVLSLHVPLTESTYHLVDNNYLRKFRKNIWLINTSRGEVVHTADLLEAIQKGQVLGAALDVLEYENPAFGDMELNLKSNSVLRELIQTGKVILTPHIAGLTEESSRKLATAAARKIISFVKEA